MVFHRCLPLCRVVFAAGLLLFAAPAAAQDLSTHLRNLSKSDQAEGAVEALVRIGDGAIPKLLRVVRGGDDMASRGWAVIALGRIPGRATEHELTKLHNDDSLPELVRTWAAAARIARTRSANQLMGLAKLQGTFPALDRPIKKQFAALLGSGPNKMSTGDMLRLATRMPQMQAMIVEPVLGGGAKPLIEVMTRSGDDNLRRQAAAYLATLAQRQGPAGVANAVVDAYRFRAGTKDVPWSGGALFVPGIAWPKEQATKLVDGLIAWHLWCDVRGKANLQKQIHNNIRSLSLAGVVGYSSPGWNEVGTRQWLLIWRNLKGRDAVRRILKAQGLDEDSSYRALAEQK